MQACQNLTAKAEDEVKPAKLPTPERSARLEVMKQKYLGIKIEGELEPSCALIDKLHTMKVSGELRVLGWEELTKRESELTGGKTFRQYKTDPNGFLKEELVKVESKASVDEKMDLRSAL